MMYSRPAISCPFVCLCSLPMRDHAGNNSVLFTFTVSSGGDIPSSDSESTRACKSQSPTDSSENSYDEFSSSDEEDSSMCASLTSCSSCEDIDGADNLECFSILPMSQLYETSRITVFESYLLLFQYAIKNSLTLKAFTELLQLVSAFLPSSAQIPSSVHHLKQVFIRLFPHAQPSIQPLSGKDL